MCKNSIELWSEALTYPISERQPGDVPRLDIHTEHRTHDCPINTKPCTNQALFSTLLSLHPVWDAMVEGHSSKPAKRVHHVTQTPIREPSAGSYEHNPLFDDVSTDNNRHQPYASSADNDHLNEATASSASSSSSYASDMDAMYDPVPQRLSHRQHQNNNNNHQRTRIQQQQLESQSQPDAQYVLPDASNVRNIYAAADILPSPYLSGPMIIRVRPDGTPVEEDSRRQLPRDDDREAMTIGREKLPTAEQIASEFGSGSYRTAVRMY